MNIGNVEVAADHAETAAECLLPEPEALAHPFKVSIIYNGLTKEFEVRLDEVVQQLLDQARQKFGPINNAHLLGLFTQGGVELNDGQTVDAARHQAWRCLAPTP